MRLITAFTGLATILASASALADGCRHGGPGMAPAGMYMPAMPMAYGAPHPMPQGIGTYHRGYHHGYVHAKGYGDAAMTKTSTPEDASAPATGDIVEIAAGAGSFNTLVSAVKAAGLVDTLKGEGPFTVFAPTDEAFAQIPEVMLKALLNDKEALAKVLTYHVVAGKVMAADVVKLGSAKTVQGQAVLIDVSDGVTVDGAKVLKTDIIASNGVIHVIDRVILPN